MHGLRSSCLHGSLKRFESVISTALLPIPFSSLLTPFSSALYLFSPFPVLLLQLIPALHTATRPQMQPLVPIPRVPPADTDFISFIFLFVSTPFFTPACNAVTLNWLNSSSIILPFSRKRRLVKKNEVWEFFILTDLQI